MRTRGFGVNSGTKYLGGIQRVSIEGIGQSEEDARITTAG
jgi:hypothetical protein